MLLKSIEFLNFRQYIGCQKIDFSCDKHKNVTVLIGKNTSGKTTFIRAFEWCLYNKIEFDDDILLNSKVVDNMNIGETQKVMVKIVLMHEEKEYEITRTNTYTCTGVDSNTKKTQVRRSLTDLKMFYLQSDGQTKTEIEHHEVQAGIDRILPPNLSSYFFFGGERIGKICNSGDIEASVKGLMRLDVLENARTHLRSVINQFKKGLDLAGDKNALQAQTNLDSRVKQLQVLDLELINVQNEIDYYQTEKEKYSALLKANEDTAADQKRREQLDSVISSLEGSIEADSGSLVKNFNRNSFAFFGMPIMKKAMEFLRDAKDTTESVPDMHADSIDYIIHRGYCICGTKIGSGTAAEIHLLEEKAKQPPESIGAIVRGYKEKTSDYLSVTEHYYDQIKSKYMEIRKSKKELSLRKDEKENLSNSLKGKEDTKKLEQHYCEAESKLKLIKVKESELLQRKGSYQKDIDNYQKILDSLVKANTKNTRLLACIDYTQSIFDWVNEAYKLKEKDIRGRLEKKANSNFVSMYHGSRTIMIDEKYRVKYLDVTTDESDGLKAVKSFAFVSGLVDLAKEALLDSTDQELNIGAQYYPLVMDAPFSNVDEIHIENICKVLPASAEQVIIALMQKDWEQAEKIMKPFIGKSFYIIKDKNVDGKELETSTHIKEGRS
jgi:DNA sulfur modification protein DndD